MKSLFFRESVDRKNPYVADRRMFELAVAKKALPMKLSASFPLAAADLKSTSAVLLAPPWLTMTMNNKQAVSNGEGRLGKMMKLAFKKLTYYQR